VHDIIDFPCNRYTIYLLPTDR